MSTALYQKYRPKTFAELINQNHIKITLQNEIAQGKIGHAYLFYGPRAVGKTTTARLLAKAVNCEQKKDGTSEPCNKCESCEEINSDRSIDIIEIDAASHTGVDNVRENIIANARVATSKRRYKVFIIDEVHMLSISAFNALLKTLEEPPKNVIFILATTEIHKVPSTIISRCQRFDFKKISNSEMVERLKLLVKLEKKQIDDTVLENIARQAGGYVRDAESLLGQVLSLDEKKISAEQAEIIIQPSNFNLVAEFVEYIINKDKVKAIEQINNLVDEGVDLAVFSKDLIEFLRKLLFSKISNTLDNFAIRLDKKLESRVSKMKDNANLDYLIKALNIFIIRSKEVKSADIAQLPLEMAIIELVEQSTTSNQQLTNRQQRSQEDQKLEIRNWKLGVNNQDGAIKKTFNFASQAIKKAVSTSGKREEGDALSEPADNDIRITFEQIKAGWPKVVEYIRKNEPGLSFMLGAAKPAELDGYVLKIGFRHKFHCDALKINGKQEKLEKIIEDILGERLKISCFSDLTIDINSVKVTPEIKEENKELKNIDDESGEDLKGVLDMFGGKVIS
jgi:DNA polymerase-3 subunit gamma/tau